MLLATFSLFVFKMLVIFLLVLVNLALPKKIDIYGECGVVYNCIGIGGGSCVTEKSCQYLVGLRYDAQKGKLRTLFYGVKQKYVAIGISEDVLMGNDDVLMSFTADNKSPVFVSARNVGKTLQDTYVLSPSEPPTFQIANGGFISKATFTLASLPAKFQFKNSLGNEPYFLQIAAGMQEEPGDGNSLFGFHERDVAVSSVKLKFTQVQNVSSDSGTEYVAHKIHAVCMIWTWMFLIPVGIVIPRYYKETWSHIRRFRRRLWFILHVVTMLLSLVFVLSGYVAIIIKNSGIFRNPWNSNGLRIHQAVGFISIVLLITQTYTNWFRVRHPVLKTLLAGAHALMGLTCYITGIYNIVMAEMLVGKDVMLMPKNLQYFPLVSLFFLILTFLAVSSYYSWTDSHLSVPISRAFCSFPLTICTDEEAPRPKLRTGILIVFIALAFIVSIVYTTLLLSLQP